MLTWDSLVTPIFKSRVMKSESDFTCAVYQVMQMLTSMLTLPIQLNRSALKRADGLFHSASKGT